MTISSQMVLDRIDAAAGRVDERGREAVPNTALPDGLNIFAVGGTFGRKENAVSSPRNGMMEISPSLAQAYDQAWVRYEARCLWNVRRAARPTPEDARDVAQRLRQYGDMSARRLATRIDGEANAA